MVMTKSEFYFKDASIADLEKVYTNLHELEDAAETFSPEWKMLGDCASEVYDELVRRGEEDRGIFLMLRRKLASIDTDALHELHNRLDSNAVHQDIFRDDFTEDGDPITDAASIMLDFTWFLELELKKRGEKVR